uniref:Glioma tumor suppressor candidate region gene 1 protein-like n=1 Tax=Sinocyclocheilus grahami TaxID=75366 RepID=A0A672K2I4_SINGR
MLSSVLAHPGLQLQSQVMNKAISVQPFVQQVGLGNVTLQPISSLQALPNGSQSGPLGIGQIQVVGQPTVMTINPSGQQILAKTMGGYQLHQPGPEAASAGTQGGLGGSVLSSGGGLLIQGGKATLGSPALNGPAVCLSNTNTNNSSTTMATAGGIVGFGNASLGAGIGSQTQPQGQIMQNVIIQRTPTPIQPKPPQGGAIQPKVFKQQQQLPAPHALPNDTNKALGVQQIPVSAGQNVTFLGKPGSNVVLSTQATSQGTQFSQALFKQQGPQTSGKPLSVHLLNQQGSIVIPSQTVLQSQNHQFLLPGLQAGGQILTQHPGGHIITSQGPGGQIIANQILTANQNINLGQMLASQGHPGAAHILSGHIQLQPGQMGQPTLFQMPVSLAQTQTQAHPVTGHVQTVIQGMPIQNSLSVESLSPAVSLQTLQQSGGIPNNSNSGSTAMAPCQPGEGITVLGGSTDPAAQSAQTQLQPSILTVQTTPQVSVAASVPSSSSPSPTMVTSTSSMVGLGPQAQHSPGKVLFTSPGSSMILSQESLQMFLQQVPSAAHSQSIKIQSASPSQPVVTPAPTPTLTDSPQPAQASPITIGQQIQSPHQHQQSRPPSQPQPQSQAQTPSRSCTPSSLPPLFIIHNQIGGSPQPPQQQQQQQPQQVQVQLQPQVLPQPTALQPDIPPSSCSPKPPQPLPAQFQFQPVVSSPPAAVVKQQVTVVPGLTAEQQHHLQLVSAQLQTMSSITQPSPQQKQLLEKLHQVQQNIFLQAKQQAQAQVQAQAQASQQQATNQFNKMPDHHSVQAATSTASVTIQAPVQSLLQQKSVLVKSSTTGANDTQVFSAGATVNQGITTPNLAQAVQAKPGVISSVGGLTLSKAGLQIQVLGTALSQMSAPTPPALQTQTSTLKRPFSLEPSKEARMLEQLRKQQGSVLHPDYSSPFHSFEDKLHRLLPYHLYQGMASSPEDYRKVDDEFENVSCQLLKRTQAMVDKYRHLLFEESKRLGPSAEMVMIDRMFIQEEKVALNQDRVLAKEKPEEFVANSCLLDSSVVRPVKVELSSVRTASSSAAGAGQPVAATPPPAAAVAPAPTPTPAPTPAAAPTPASTPALFPPTKLVIKQGGRGASVSWSTSSTPTLAPVVRPSAEPVTPSASFSRTPSSRPADDDDDVALPQRTSKPPIKTYEARQRIGLKLKIKQEAGFSKVVHNTALDPVHSQSQLTPQPPTPEQPQKVKPTHVTPPITVIRTPPPTSYTTPSSTVTTVTTHTGSASSSATSSSGPTPSFSSSWSSSSPSTSTAQMNGTLEHHEVGGVKRNPASTATPPLTTCRLPLRKTYRENISPRRRPGVPGGGGDMLPIVPAGPPITSSPQPQGSSPQPERTVIASVKLERQGGHGQSHPHAESQSLAAVEDVLYRGIKNAYQHHRDFSDKEDEVEAEKGGGLGRLKGIGSKNREGGRGTFRMDQHAPGPPSPGESSCTRDSTLPAKRCKSDSPDMDNASFSSGSPPPDDSLNEHLQCAIDSILNLQQGPPGHGGSGKGALGRVHGENLPNQHQTHPSYRQSMPPLSTPTSSTPMSQHPQVGGRGQNGNLVSQTHSR